LAASQAREEDNDGFRSPWVLEPTEFPVSVQGSDTRIDFILRHAVVGSLLVAECKRTNPAYSEWCFCRSAWVARDYADWMYVQRLLRAPQQLGVSARVAKLQHFQGKYNLGIEVKGKAKGDNSSEPQSMEKAFGQVCRGVSGLVEHLNRYPDALGEKNAIDILPVVFTTARLWTSDVDLKLADLRTGAPAPVTSLKKVDWLFCQYPLSPGLMHSLGLAHSPQNLSEFLLESLRTIAVVRATAAKNFFRDFNPSNW